jgi:serine protease Do
MTRLPLRLPLVLAVTLALAGTAGAEGIGEVLKRVNPSVVTIRTKGKEVAAEQAGLAAFGGVGSGVLIAAGDKVLTAAHVVNGVDEITVTFLDGEAIAAHVVSSEPDADVALIELAHPPRHPVVAALGDSDSVEVGDQVFVVGAPYGIAHSLSVGYVSARHKPNTVYSALSRAEFFQTDAAINQGNSGGPMFNMKGEVIGVVSHIISKSGGFEGLGFVVTVNMARHLVLDRKSFWTGMSGVAISGELAEALNLPQPAGLLVQHVAAKSPAAQMGLHPGHLPVTVEGKSVLLGGDVILKVQGIEYQDSSSRDLIQEALDRLPTGAPVQVTVFRGGKAVELSARVP